MKIWFLGAGAQEESSEWLVVSIHRLDVSQSYEHAVRVHSAGLVGDVICRLLLDLLEFSSDEVLLALLLEDPGDLSSCVPWLILVENHRLVQDPLLARWQSE